MVRGAAEERRRQQPCGCALLHLVVGPAAGGAGGAGHVGDGAARVYYQCEREWRRAQRQHGIEVPASRTSQSAGGSARVSCAGRPRSDSTQAEPWKLCRSTPHGEIVTQHKPPETVRQTASAFQTVPLRRSMTASCSLRTSS